jgi:pimeloyl-ACP methyl ester carboxylesterase
VVVDGFAAERPVIVFDNAGVGGSSGTTPEDIAEMTRHALAFIKAIGLPQLDLLGFSLGGAGSIFFSSKRRRAKKPAKRSPSVSRAARWIGCPIRLKRL